MDYTNDNQFCREPATIGNDPIVYKEFMINDWLTFVKDYMKPFQVGHMFAVTSFAAIQAVELHPC